MIVTVPRVGYRMVVPTVAEHKKRKGPPLVAVLPFVNYSPTSEDGYFGEGVADEIITALSQFKTFAVISRGASFALSKDGEDAIAKASALGIGYALEGGARRVDDRLRVTASLLDVANGTQLWSERFDGTVSEIFSFQDRIVEAVAGVVEPEIRKAEVARARRKPTASLDAYDYFLRALQHIHSPGVEGHPEALRLLQLSSDLDPEFALAPAHAAWIYEKRLSLRAPPIGRDDVAAGTALARRALSLDGADPLVRAICGYVLYRLAGDVTGIQALHQAVEDNPNNSAILALAAAGIGLRSTMQERAYHLWQKAYELSPGAPEAYQFLFGMAAYELRQGNFQGAIDWSLKSLATFNDWLFSYITLTAAYVGLDHMDEARATLRRVREISPHLTIRLIEEGRAVEDSFADAVVPALRKAGLPEY
jgi:TolB-like protein